MVNASGMVKDLLFKVPANPQWTQCVACEGAGYDPKDRAYSCATCGGQGQLLFCSCCLSYQEYGSGGVCQPCRGDALHTANATGVSLDEALDGLKAQWAVEHARETREAA